jgi:hypothetical protein
MRGQESLRQYIGITPDFAAPGIWNLGEGAAYWESSWEPDCRTSYIVGYLPTVTSSG